MTSRFRIGNSLSGGSPAHGSMRMVRAGRALSSYEYDTIDFRELGASKPAGRHVVVDEMDRLFGRFPGSDPRATTRATAFVTLDREDEGKYRVVRAADMHPDAPELRTHGVETETVQSAGLILKAHTQGKPGEDASQAWFDNAHLDVSNILWEFSMTGGDGKWWKLYDLPNRKYVRINLPSPTNIIRARAVSNNPNDWVQAIAITPHPDWQTMRLPLQDFQWDDGGGTSVGTGTPSVDDFGNVTWGQANGGHGAPLYQIYKIMPSDYRKFPTITVPRETTEQNKEDRVVYFSRKMAGNLAWASDQRAYPCYIVTALDESVPRSPCIRLILADANDVSKGMDVYYDENVVGDQTSYEWCDDSRAIPFYYVSSWDEVVPRSPCVRAIETTTVTAEGKTQNYTELQYDSTVKSDDPMEWMHDDRMVCWVADAKPTDKAFGVLFAVTRSLHWTDPNYKSGDYYFIRAIDADGEVIETKVFNEAGQVDD